MKQPRYRQTAQTLYCQSLCDQADLVRYCSGKLLSGPIEVGQLYVWEPYNPNAVELVLVTKIVERGPTHETAIYTKGRPNSDLGQTPIWNDVSRFREAVVRSNLKAMALSESFITSFYRTPLWADYVSVLDLKHYRLDRLVW